MKKFALLFLSIHSIVLAQTQNRKLSFLTKFQYLYEKDNEKSNKVGVFASSAEIYVINNLNNGFSFVEATNGDKGYIKTSVITDENMGYKDENEPKKIFYRGIEGYQCPHKFVQVSGLRVRKEPSVNSKITRILELNEMICYNYFPLAKDGWINIGNEYQGENEYIQFKNLGEELTYQKVFSDYKNSLNKAEEKTQVERLLEIGWDSPENENLEALKVYRDFCVKNSKTDVLENLDFEIFLLENMQNHYDSADTAKTWVKFDFIIHKKLVKLANFREKQINGLGVQFTKTKDFSSLQECAIDPYILYKSDDVSIFFEKNDENKREYATINYLKFLNNSALIINDFEISENTSEKEFIKKFGKIFTIDWKHEPHIYRFSDGDAGFLKITFKNGKPFNFENLFYC